MERNPVRAPLYARPEDWQWSSARAYLAGADDELVSVRPLLEMISDWARLVGTDIGLGSGLGSFHRRD